MRKKKIYLLNALTSIAEWERDNVDLVISRLRSDLGKDFEILNPVGFLTDVDEAGENDAKCISECDLVIAECTHAATGMGISIGIAAAMGKSVILGLETRPGHAISRIVKSLPSRYPSIKLVDYSQISELADVARKILSSMKEEPSLFTDLERSNVA